jgi:hypothetical protein
LGLVYLGTGDTYELVCAHLERILLLGIGTADRNDLVRAKGLSPEKTEVAETADTDDTDTLTGTAAVLLQGRIESDTTAQHGRGLGRVDAVGDGENEVRISPPVLSISTVGLLASGPFGVVSTDH